MTPEQYTLLALWQDIRRQLLYEFGFVLFKKYIDPLSITLGYDGSVDLEIPSDYPDKGFPKGVCALRFADLWAQRCPASIPIFLFTEPELLLTYTPD